jgi:serine/threonine-protein kinase
MQTIPREWDPEGMATWARYTALWAQRRYADALDMLDRSRTRLSRDGYVYQPMPLMRARLYDTMGEPAKARSSYLLAREVLEDSVASRPGDASIRIALGLAYAGLGRRAEAVREARQAMELVPLAGNTPAATAFMGGAVEVFARAGETDAALELLELLFSMPAGREVTRAFLQVWPGFDGLRKDPRLEELLVRYAAG